MNAIWILLGLAVLFGGAILVFVLRAVRHDDAGDPTAADTEVGRFRRDPECAHKPDGTDLPIDRGPAGTEVGRFSRDPESDHKPDGTDLPIDRGPAGTEVGRFTEDSESAHGPEAAGLCAGRGTGVQS